MSEEQGEVTTAATSDVNPAPLADQVMAAVTAQVNISEISNGMAELQLQIQQLQNQHKEAASENQSLLATLEKEREEHRQLQLSAGPGLEELPGLEPTLPAIMTDGLASRVQRLERELQARTEERENYKNKLQLAEKLVVDSEAEKAAALAAAKQNDMSAVDLSDKSERSVVQETLEKLTATLKESTEQNERFERQNSQLHSQVKALKEVIAVHKDLLAIRGMESDQLKTTIRLLEEHSKAEKERRAAVLAKMEAAVRLNLELKTEYETQLRIFNDLRCKYELKVELMSAENQRLKKLLPVEDEEPAIIEEQLAVGVQEPVLE